MWEIQDHKLRTYHKLFLLLACQWSYRAHPHFTCTLWKEHWLCLTELCQLCHSSCTSRDCPPERSHHLQEGTAVCLFLPVFPTPWLDRDGTRHVRSAFSFTEDFWFFAVDFNAHVSWGALLCCHEWHWPWLSAVLCLLFCFYGALWGPTFVCWAKFHWLWCLVTS